MPIIHLNCKARKESNCGNKTRFRKEQGIQLNL